jgi:NitT/TauT family transport system permease protein
MIGILGFGTDLVLGGLGRKFFPWDRSLGKEAKV